MGSVIAPEKESYQENLYLETKLRIRSPLFVFQWPEFMRVLHCPEGLCFCTLGSDWEEAIYLLSIFLSCAELRNINRGKWGYVNFPWIFWCEWFSCYKGFPVKYIQINRVNLILMIPLSFTSSGKVKDYPERQWLYNCMQMVKTHNKKCPPIK